ncbi:sugar kinase [Heyndrickxia acidiproducens]|uniref:sugar kinase n=1 Tax=Heyndrickxia acidiproducens TaxID=1121084 RepID=UPI00037A7442|nr:sugar kinase [Heyndrickxia acidiproducens]
MPKVLALGEALLRLSTEPGELLNSSHSLQVHYGGAEANVASALANLGHSVSFASKLPDSPLGMAVVRGLRANGIDIAPVLFGGKRLGVYFVEQGNGPRYSKVIYDRACSSFCEMGIKEWNFDKLFAGVELFHITGITFALSKAWQKNGQILVREAHKRSIPVSFDFNYRPSMWPLEEAIAAIRPILPMISYCCINYLDARNFFGINEAIAVPDHMEACYREISRMYPNFRAIYATNRQVVNTSHHQLQGLLWMKGKFAKTKQYQINPVTDRIGGGDAFVAGMLHGILEGMEITENVQFATGMSLLKHTIKGDSISLNVSNIQEWLNSTNREVRR